MELRLVRRSRRRSLSVQIVPKLRDAIVRGLYRPGQRLVERELCEALGVSRTPLREALKILEVEGLVDLSQNRGARVAPFTAVEARELFAVIAELEALAVVMVIHRDDKMVLQRLSSDHDAMAEAFRNGDKDRYFDLNSAIHQALVDACGNSVLIESHARLMLRAKRGRYMAIVDPQRWAEAFEEHAALIRAIETRDDAGARAIWRGHLLKTGDTIGRLLESLPGATRAA